MNVSVRLMRFKELGDLALTNTARRNVQREVGEFT